MLYAAVCPLLLYEVELKSSICVEFPVSQDVPHLDVTIQWWWVEDVQSL